MFFVCFLKSYVQYIFKDCYINFHFDLIVKYFQPSGDEASGQMLSSSPAAALDFLNVQDFSHNPTVHRSSSMTDCGACSEQFIKMGLPSFRPSYLFLLQVFMDVVHEAFRLRLDQRPNGEPTHLSIRPVSISSPLLAHLAKSNVSFCRHLTSVVCLPWSINFSHFNLLLWYPLAKWSETW